MRFGIWLDFRNPPPWRQPWTDIYRDSLSLATLAEDLGFDSVWVSEHHLTADGYLPSVFPTLAAIAARTERIRLGTAVLLAPLHHPLRLAEDAAVVDQLSDGRLDLGVAPGYRQHEFDTLGIARTERGRRTDEAIEILRLAWRGRPFSYAGRCFQFNNVTVAPPPHQSPHPPIWVGGNSQAAAIRAGRLGCHFLPDGGTPTDFIALYRVTLANHGHDPGDFEITTTASVHICEDPDRGWTQVKDHYLYAANLYREWYERPTLPSADALDRSRYLVGPPPAIIDGLEQIQAANGVDRVIFFARLPGLAVKTARDSLRLFAEHVIPHFT